MTTMIKPIKRSVALVCFLAIVSGLELEAKSSITGDQSADVIFIGDHIITVDSASIDVTAVAVAGQDIIATGSAEEISTNFFISLPVVSKDKSFLSSVLSDEPIICGVLSILPSGK